MTEESRSSGESALAETVALPAPFDPRDMPLLERRALDISLALAWGWTELAMGPYSSLEGRNPEGQVRRLPYFSRDIAAAWPVVEWMQQEFTYVRVDAVTYDSELVGWGCVVGSVADEMAATAPEAICRAALSAIRAAKRDAGEEPSPPPKRLPHPSELRGLDPDFTGGMETVAYLRELRGGAREDL